MEHVALVLRYSNRRSVPICRHIEWRYRMLAAIIFSLSYSFSSCLMHSHAARRAPSYSVVSSVTIIVHINSNFVCYCAVRHTKYLNCCIGFAVFRCLLMYSLLLVWFPTNRVVLLSSDYVLYLLNIVTSNYVATFQVLTAVWLKIPVFWHMTSCIYQSIRRNIFRFTQEPLLVETISSQCAFWFSVDLSYPFLVPLSVCVKCTCCYSHSVQSVWTLCTLHTLLRLCLSHVFFVIRKQ